MVGLSRFISFIEFLMAFSAQDYPDLLFFLFLLEIVFTGAAFHLCSSFGRSRRQVVNFKGEVQSFPSHTWVLGFYICTLVVPQWISSAQYARGTVYY